MRPRGKPADLEQRRMKAVSRVLEEGLAQAETARRIGVSPRVMNAWVQRYRKDGEKGLKARPNTGRPPKLMATRKKRLEAILVKGAAAAGFSTDLWTCPRINEVIRRTFGVSYHVDHIGRLLHALGWSPQKPQRKAIERDEKAIRRWVRRQWPRIKKKPGRSGRRSVL